jgi:hypothetical protein
MMSHMVRKTTDHTMLERFAADTIDTLTCGGLALSAPFLGTRRNSDIRMDKYIADPEKPACTISTGGVDFPLADFDCPVHGSPPIPGRSQAQRRQEIRR